jgi:hypothetical protein
MLSIQTGERELAYESVEALEQRLCEALDSRCLVPDEGDNPYVMWLVSPREARRRVELDPVEYDEERYRIAR